jgi:hypothetical protein
VRGFRAAILGLHVEANLHERLHDRMEAVYGQVLPGYGTSGAEAAHKAGALYFTIGPEAQLTSWEEYLRSVEPGAVLHRLYPRDFWHRSPDVHLSTGS